MEIIIYKIFERVQLNVGGKGLNQSVAVAKAVDTTAAGDTFCGYFLAGLCAGAGIPECLERASAASAIAVSRPGAAPSIPLYQEVKQFLKER